MKKFLYMLRWLRREAHGVRAYSALVALAGMAGIACSLFFVWTTKHVIDIATGVSEDSFAAAVVMLLSALAGQLLFSAVSKRASAVCTTRFSNRLRARLFRLMLFSRWRGRERFHSTDALGRLITDVATTSGMVGSTIPGVVVTLTQLLAAFVFLVCLNAKMAAVLVVIMPVALVCSKLYMKRSHRLTRQIRAQETEISRVSQEGLQHRVLIATLKNPERYVAKFREAQEEFYSLVMKRNSISLFASTAVTAGFMAGYTVAFLWCANGLMTGAVTFGMMTAFLQLVAQVQRPVVDLAGKIPAFVNAGVAIERIDEVREEAKMPEETSDGTRAPRVPSLNRHSATKESSATCESTMGMLKLEDVGFAYPDGEGEVIAGVSHVFAPGSMTAVAGDTGAGKTTLLMLMLGFARPTKGRIVGAGEEMVFVPQGNSLMSGTVRENLLMADPEASDARMREALHAACADFVLELPEGLDSSCGERGGGFSEGEAQRIAIARGLLGEGRVMLLDEPTSALDPETESLLMEHLRVATKGRTLIIVTHREQTMAACDEILRLRR